MWAGDLFRTEVFYVDPHRYYWRGNEKRNNKSDKEHCDHLSCLRYFQYTPSSNARHEVFLTAFAPISYSLHAASPVMIPVIIPSATESTGM